ncbi:MAG: hypothetical protein ACTHU0_10440, partial [Kofleriaceae bacterium]
YWAALELIASFDYWAWIVSKEDACMSCERDAVISSLRSTRMKVRELMMLLEELDPNAQVFIMSPMHWPVEYTVDGIAIREELQGDDDEGLEEGTSASDVFIVEGDRQR